MKKTDFDNFVSNYNQLLDSQLFFFDSNNNYFSQYKVKKLKKLFPQDPINILDFGCGIGRSIPYFQKYFVHSNIFGCDPSTKSLDVAKNQFPLATFFNAQELLSSNKKFDLIFLSGVLHHIPPTERQKTIALLTSLLVTNGTVVIFEHNPFNPVTRHLVNTCPFDEDAILLTPKETKQLLRDQNLQKISCEYTLFFPEKLQWLRPLEHLLRHIPLGGQYCVKGVFVS